MTAKAALSGGFCLRDAPQEYFHFLIASLKKIRSPGGTVLALMGAGTGSWRHNRVAGSIIELNFLRPRCSNFWFDSCAPHFTSLIQCQPKAPYDPRGILQAIPL